MTQTNWSSLGTPVLQTEFPSSPTVGRNADGRLEVFFNSQDGIIWHIWQTSPGGTWSSWASLNKPPNISFTSGTAVGENADGRLEVFITGSDGMLWHIWQVTAGGGWHNSWFSLGRPSAANLESPPAVVRNADGRLEVFSIDTNGALWHIWQTSPNGTWSSWVSLGTPTNVQFVPTPGVNQNADGRLEVFIPGSDGALWHIWQITAGGSWHNSWFSSGQPSTTVGIFFPAGVIQNADGRLEVFALGRDGALWHIWQTSPNGNWNTWTSFGTPSNVNFVTAPTVNRNKDGRLEVLITGNDGALWHIWQTSPGRDWSTLVSLGAPTNTSLTPFSSPVVSENADGRLEVFAETGGVLWHAWQIIPSGGWG
jgi:hypothetical protein